VSREDFLALHRAFETVRQWPPPVRRQVLRWFAPEAFPAPSPAVATSSTPAETWPEVWRPRSKQRAPRLLKPLRPHGPDRTRILELELLEAMQDHPGASVSQLATITGVLKSRTLWRLHALAAQGEIEKDPATGRWRLA
jgi:hypothetical protein